MPHHATPTASDESAALASGIFAPVKPLKDLEQAARDVFPMPEIQHADPPAKSSDQEFASVISSTLTALITPANIRAVGARVTDLEACQLLEVLARMIERSYASHQDVKTVIEGV